MYSYGGGYSYTSSYVAPKRETPEENLANYRASYPDAKDGLLDAPLAEKRANLDFQSGAAKADQREDFHISDFHAPDGKFCRDWDKLESMHCYIQWLFPLCEKSPFNGSAPVLQREEIVAIAADPVAVGNAVASFKTMLAFYGLDIVDDATGEIARVVDSVECAERYRNLNTKAHNYRRITRISKYLGEIGLGHLVQAWHAFLVEDVLGRGALPAVKSSLVEWWVPCIKDDVVRAALLARIAEHKVYSENPVLHFSLFDSRDEATYEGGAAGVAGVSFGLNNDASDIGVVLDVYWPKDEAWYRAKITAFTAYTKVHKLTYEDGDMRSHTALRDSDSLALRVARAVPLDERDAFLAAHGGDEAYTLPPIWTSAPVKAAVVMEGAKRESAADPSLIPPKDAYSIGEPVLVACFLETSSSSSEGAADDNSTAKWRPAVVTAFGGDGDGVSDGQDATPPGDGVVGALGDAGYSVVFDDDAIESRSGVPVFSLRPMKEPFPVGVKVKALKQTYTTKYYEQATVKSRQPNGFYELSFGYSPLYQTLKIVAPSAIERPPTPITLAELLTWDVHLPVLRAAGAALTPPSVVAIQLYESDDIVENISESDLVPCLKRSVLESLIADDVEGEVAVGALKSLVDHRMHLARVSAVTDEVVAAAAGGVAASSRFKSEQAKLKARLAERKARLAAMRVQDGSAAPPLPPADAAGVAGAADAAVDCDDDAEEAVESYAAAAVSFPAIRGHAPAVSLPLQWIVDKSFASSDIKSTYSKGGAGAGSQEARVPLAVGDKVVRYIGRKYGTAANWQAGTVVSIGLALPSSGATESATGAPSPPTVNAKLNGLVRLWRGDITRLEVDAIQNAANAQLSSGGGICGAIHKAAGPALATACKAIGDEPSKVDYTEKKQATVVKKTSTYGGYGGYGGGVSSYLTTRCPEGETRVTRGYNLIADHVLHTVGPTGEKPAVLRSAYRSALDCAKERGLKTIALCAVSTGIYGYKVEAATPVAVLSVREWLDESAGNAGAFNAIVFCVFNEKDEAVYQRYLPVAFPDDIVASEE